MSACRIVREPRIEAIPARSRRYVRGDIRLGGACRRSFSVLARIYMPHSRLIDTYRALRRALMPRVCRASDRWLSSDAARPQVYNRVSRLPLFSVGERGIRSPAGEGVG